MGPQGDEQKDNLDFLSFSVSESIEETTDEFHATVTMSAFLKPFLICV